MGDELNNQSSLDNTRELLKKRLELELGLPLFPRSDKQYIRHFNGDSIILNHYPITDISVFCINEKPVKKYILMEKQGIIHLPHQMAGTVLIEYSYALPEEEYTPLLDLMVDYENDNNKLKDATSVSEGKVSVSFDKSTTKGALIQVMIVELRKRHTCNIRVV